MSWDDAAALVDAGWEVGSHTCTHQDLTALDDVSLRAELVESRTELEDRLRARCRSLAYPYGRSDRRVMVAARCAGYLAAAGLPARIHRRHRFCWPRVGVWHNDPAPVFEVKLSRWGRRRLDFVTGAMRPVPRWRLASP
jgi:peptidoglycan/xylan/chitin deacetylase (PgdA/CDA1 family)